MRSTWKKAVIAVAIVSTLSGCSASAVSTHATTADAAVVSTNNVGKTRGLAAFLRPKSDHVSLKGDKSKAFMAAGQEHFHAQNYGLAEANFRKAVEARSDNATAWLGLAASLDQLGRFEFSDRAYAQLKKLKKGNARVYNNIGYSYLLRGDYEKARNYLNRAQTIDPTLEEVQGNIHLLEKTVRS